MALATAKITELPLRNAFPLTSTRSPSLRSIFTSQKPPSKCYFSSSLRTTSGNENRTSPSSSSSPWLDKWPSSNTRTDVKSEERNEKMRTVTKNQEVKYGDRDKGQNAIERIVLRLRNLGLGSDDEEEEEEERELGRLGNDSVTGDERLGDLLRREWVRPDSYLSDSEDEEREGDGVVLPWEKEEGDDVGETREGRRRSVKAPTLAELTIEDEELRKLRRMGMFIRERINVPKAGITQAVLDKIHDKWRKEELVRLKFHEVLAHDMKTAHEIVERRTGGLVIWRSGSVMVLYRGSNYEGPASRSRSTEREGDALFVPDVSAAEKPMVRAGNIENTVLEKSELGIRNPRNSENLTEEEVEYNNLLDGLGPRFEEWWGTGVLPVDADLLPEKVPGYKTPFRVLPTGMRSRLTNAEMTNLRKLAKSLPSHFALGRNRNHQGLAAAIIKLWEKSLVVKIAVKRGVQNTNNKLMAEELKLLTGGTLLLRNKYYIVMFRGKDFLPPTVAAALSERQELAKQIQDVEEKVRSGVLVAAPSGEDRQAEAGTLAEFYEAQARWGREVSAVEREKMIEEATKSKSLRLVKRIEHKLAIAQAKKLRAERLLSKIEASMIPVGPDDDQETITDEERTMFRRVGLKMKAYLPLGIRGVFDGVIENMHLHWKHRELVKLLSKQKTLSFVEDTARLLEYESGGILVAIERVPKGYALIYYRGKNYRRPISLRPRNLLTKAKALKRSVAMQRHEALSQHIAEQEQKIQQMKKEIGDFDVKQCEDNWSSEADGYDEVSDFTESDDEAVFFSSDHGGDDVDCEDDEESNMNDLKFRC